MQCARRSWRRENRTSDHYHSCHALCRKSGADPPREPRNASSYVRLKYVVRDAGIKSDRFRVWMAVLIVETGAYQHGGSGRRPTPSRGVPRS